MLLAVGLTLFCIQLDFFGLSLALPRMARDLGVAATELQWAISAYMLALGAFLILGGRIGDVFGRRRALLAGIGIFGFASLLCGAAPSAEVLIAFRVVQGAGAAIIFPVAISVLTDAFPQERRGVALGRAFGLAAIGTALGPFTGGALTELASWRWVFFLNVPFSVVALALAASSVRESRDESAPRRLDLLGVLTSSSAIVAGTLAIDRGSTWGWASARTLGAFALALLLLAAFLVRERTARNPLVELRLLRNVPYVVVTSAGAVANATYSITVFASTLYLQSARGLAPLMAGLVFLPQSVAVAFAGPLAGRLSTRLRPEQVMASAALAGGVCLLALTFATSWWLYVPLLGLAGIGFGVGWAYTNIGTQAVVRPERAGEASGVTLMIAISFGGCAIAGAATALELLGDDGAAATGSSIEQLLRVVAGIMLLSAAVLTTRDVAGRGGRARHGGSAV